MKKTASIIIAATASLALLAQDRSGVPRPTTRPPLRQTVPVETKIESAVLTNGLLVVVKRQQAREFIGPMETDRTFTVWRETYCASNGEVVLQSSNAAVYTPPKTITTPESIQFTNTP